MAVQNQVWSNFLECVGLVISDWLLSTVHNTGLKRGVQFVEGNNRWACAKAFYHTVHNRVIGHTQLHAL